MPRFVPSLFAFWVSAAVVHAEQALTVAISAPVDLTAACDAPTNDRGIHGGTQGRIARTSHGTYMAYLGGAKGEEAVIHLIRARDGRPERLASLPTTLAGSNGVHVVCDADQEVYVLAVGSDSVAGKERAVVSAYHVDRTTGATTEYAATVSFGRGGSFGYGSAFLDASGRSAYALYSGGDAPGFFAWTRFDMAERRWTSEMVVADLGFRHCYNYGFGLAGGGFEILSERDIRIETAGVSPTDPGRDPGTKYVWDELRLFQFPDPAKPEHRAVDVEAAVYDKPAGLYPNVQNNYGGDTYVDARGRMHVLYRSTDNNRTKGGFNRLAILDEGRRVVFNELLPFQEASAMRMFESISGRLFIASMPHNQPACVKVWGAVDAEGAGYELLAEERLSGDVSPSYAGLAASCPRNGSIRDDVIDGLFPSGKTYHYFQIRLK